MKKINFLFLFLCTFCCQAQWTTKSFTHGGTARQYRVYLPSGYNSTQHYPLVMTLHGLGDNMTNFSNIGMDVIADTAKFIVVVPQAILDPIIGATAWNSGAGMLGIYPNTNIDDVGFLSALIDTLQNAYTINKNRVYVCGFSMGGYMTERLGCQLTDKLAAIASMAGTIGNGLSSCNPSRVLPVAHFHGTNDQTVPFTGNNSGIDADSLIRFWVAKDGCNPTPAHSVLPNTANDGYIVDHYSYEGTTTNAVVELFKVNGADHVWLTQANDISYSAEAWRFFSRYERPSATGIDQIATNKKVNIFPNPAKDYIVVSLSSESVSYRIINLTGQLMLKGNAKDKKVINLESLSSGIYFVNIITDGYSYSQKIILKK